jgi:hypothetical protein
MPFCKACRRWPGIGQVSPLAVNASAQVCSPSLDGADLYQALSLYLPAFLKERPYFLVDQAAEFRLIVQ